MTTFVSSADAELLTAYRATTWTIKTPSAARRIRLGSGALSDPLLLPSGIITAYNPSSVALRPAENEALHRRLFNELSRPGVTMYPTLASGATDPGGEWDEPGFAVTGLDRAGLVQVASDYGQNAIVWLGGSGTARLIVTRQGFCGRAQGEFL